MRLQPLTPLPAVVAHADWGSDPRKRQVAMARLVSGSGPGLAPHYQVDRLGAAPDGREDVLDALSARPEPGPALLGFDFPIGLPAAYAAAAGAPSFPGFLAGIGSAPWREFERVAERPEEISLLRPFYPQRPGGTRRAHLYDGLGLTAQEVRRRCDGTDAETLFWTLGGRQAGKAALHGWRMLRHARARGLDVALWPFDGTLPALLAGAARVVVAETYPREFYRYIGTPPHARWSKRRRGDRLEVAPALLAWAARLDVGWHRDVLARVNAGFGDGTSGEDEFDAVIGVLGMISVVTGHVLDGVPCDDPIVTSTEGWILGRQASQTAPNRRSPASPRPGTM